MPRRPVAFGVSLALAVLGAGCGSDQPPEPRGPGGPSAQHIHGVGIDPADGSVMIATHTHRMH